MASGAASRQSTFVPLREYWPTEPKTRMFSPWLPPMTGFWSAMTCTLCRIHGDYRTITGFVLISQKVSVAESIEEIVLIWSASEADEWIGQLVWLPL
jgi:hypothetical protein